VRDDGRYAFEVAFHLPLLGLLLGYRGLLTAELATHSPVPLPAPDCLDTASAP
jgi:hypothetical protein